MIENIKDHVASQELVVFIICMQDRGLLTIFYKCDSVHLKRHFSFNMDVCNCIAN